MASSTHRRQFASRACKGLGASLCLGLSSLQLGMPLLLTMAAILASTNRSVAQTPYDTAPPPAAQTAENQRAFERRVERIRQQLRQERQQNGSSLEAEFEREIGDPSPSNPPSFGNPGLRPGLNSGSSFPNLPSLEPTFQPGFEAQGLNRYRLGPGDVLFVNVQRFPDLNVQGAINPQGALVLPLAGTLKLQGLTVSEARERIRVAFDRYVVNPQVDLSLLSQRPVRVTVAGKVASPGYYPLSNPNVSEALRLAGGTQASADLRRVVVRRSLVDGRRISQELDLYSPLVTGANPPELRLEDGDIIEVPQLSVADARSYDRSLVSTSTLASQQPVQVTVVGEVSRPGFYVLQAGRVSEALLVAGGSLSSADLRNVEVRRTLRSGETVAETIDLYSPLSEGTTLPNIRLEEGNVVSVPKLLDVDVENYNRSLIAKSTLAKPDIRVRLLSYAAGGATTLVLPSGSTFREALNGVPLDTANLRSVALVRYDPETGKAVTREINGKDALLGDPKADVPLRENDVVVVGRNMVSRLSFALNTFTQPFRDILGFLLFFDSISETASNLFRPSGGTQ